MPTWIVTGGAGFIGSEFVRQSVLRGDVRVVTLDKLTYAGNRETLAQVWEHSQHRFVQGDIADAALVARLLEEERPQAVVHLAAETHVDRSIDGPAPFVATNVVGTVRLLEEVCRYWQRLPPGQREAFRFLHVSTDEVFGTLGPEGRFTESSPYAPRSPYAASKAAADHFARAWFHTYGLPVIVTHSSNNYGPYQYPEKLIPLMTLNALEGKPLPVYGDGRQVRDWLHVADHCEALRCILERADPGSTYLIGAGEERANIDVVRAICREVDAARPDLPHAPCESLITLVADRPGHDRRYALDTSRLRHDVGWRPRHSFAAGLAATVRWYLEHLGWVERVCAGVYGRERLGLLSQPAET
ncbi:MAG: dTDP-glucose 4,6-dehydratase [Pirellulales bacterium]|nr:dTDP-glucose 4,6-dehydratase [Pirellulales bacterium]